MKDFKIRGSSAGSIMTNPRAKKDLFSKGTLTYVHDWYKERLYGVSKDFSSKYTDKGNQLEDEGIDKAIDWLDLPFILKNEEHFEDEHFTGTPDLILEDEVLDIKLSWDAFSFPLFEDELPTKDYMYQLQVYMALTGKRKSRVVYVLLNTPEDIAPWEEKHDYTEIDNKYRIKTFSVDYDEEIIADLRNRVELIREYLQTIKF